MPSITIPVHTGAIVYPYYIGVTTFDCFMYDYNHGTLYGIPEGSAVLIKAPSAEHKTWHMYIVYQEELLCNVYPTFLDVPAEFLDPRR